MPCSTTPAWAEEVERLKYAAVPALVARYEELFGEAPCSRKRVCLLRRIAWRLQANLYAGLSARALDRARALADERDVRLSAPQTRRKAASAGQKPARDARLPLPGTILKRCYRDRNISVKVLVDGFEYDGRRFTSLSGVAERVTGTRWNGFAFFGLQARKRAA